MYDRLPLSALETKEEPEVCKGKCFVLEKGLQILGLLLEETDTHYLIGYPSRCFAGEGEEGLIDYEIVSYTNLPYIQVEKSSTLISAPIHAELECFYYEYLVDNIISHEDFDQLLNEYGFSPELSSEHYVKRHIEVQEICDIEPRENDDNKVVH